MQSKSVTEGGPNQWVPKAMVRELEEWGYGNKKVVLVSDGEAAIKAVKDKMIALREAETIPEDNPSWRTQRQFGRGHGSPSKRAGKGNHKPIGIGGRRKDKQRRPDYAVGN